MVSLVVMIVEEKEVINSMIELRKDYLLDRWVILAPMRKKRPRDFVRQQVAAASNLCVFCAGHEKLTPPEIGMVAGPGGQWAMRWFSNMFPAAEESGQKDVRTDNTFYTFAASYGVHEVIVETPSHDRQLWDFSPAELKQLLQVYASRIAALEARDGIKYVAVFKNHGNEAGASIAHSHTQVVAVNVLPSLVMEEAAAVKSHAQSRGQCPYCSIVDSEKGSYRRCFENNHAVAFTPYASRFNFEVWIFPKRHFRQLSEAGEDELQGISELLTAILRKLKELNAPYNYILHYLPSNASAGAGFSDFHFHIEVQPRLSVWAGFELNTDIIINSVTPEDAAKFYRGEE